MELSELPTPVSRVDGQLATLCGMDVGELPEPIAREEQFLAYMIEHGIGNSDGGSGSVTAEQLAQAIADYMGAHPEYVKNTDYATSANAGVVKIDASYGLQIAASTGTIFIQSASQDQIAGRSSNYRPIVPSNLDYAVVSALTSNSIVLTDEQQSAVLSWLGVDTAIQAAISDTWEASY